MNYVWFPWIFLKLGLWTKDTYLYKFVMYCNWFEIATSLFITLCILRDLPQQKIPMELCSGGDPVIFLCSHENIFCWNGSGKFKKTWRKEKEEIVFTYVKIPILMCSPPVRNALRLLPLCNAPSGEPTCMGTSPTTKWAKFVQLWCVFWLIACNKGLLTWVGTSYFLMPMEKGILHLFTDFPTDL